MTCSGGARQRRGRTPRSPSTRRPRRVAGHDHEHGGRGSRQPHRREQRARTTPRPWSTRRSTAPAARAASASTSPMIRPSSTLAGPDPVVPGGLAHLQDPRRQQRATRADDVVIVHGTQRLVAANVIVSQIVTDGAQSAPSVAARSRRRRRNARCGRLNPGGTILMTVQGFVIGSAGSSSSAPRRSPATSRTRASRSTDTELTTVKPFIDLTITKSDSPDPVCARSWPGTPPAARAVCLGGLTYTLVVGNSGIGQRQQRRGPRSASAQAPSSTASSLRRLPAASSTGRTC